MKDKETKLKENLGIIAGVVSPKTKARIYVAATVGMIITTITIAILTGLNFDNHELAKHFLTAGAGINAFLLMIQQTFNGKNFKEVFKKETPKG